MTERPAKQMDDLILTTARVLRSRIRSRLFPNAMQDRADLAEMDRVLAPFDSAKAGTTDEASKP